MRILSSEVNMQAQTSSQFEHTRTVESSTTFQTLFSNPTQNSLEETQETSESEKVRFEVKQSEHQLAVRDLLNKFIIEILLSRFLGSADEDKFKMHPKDSCCCECNEIDVPMGTTQKHDTTPPPRPQSRVSFSSETQTTNEYYKNNALNFQAQASIQTADQNIDVDLDINYTQEFYEKYKENVSFESLALMDPLIIQYDLSQQYFDTISDDMSFTFDINSDGEEESIPLLKEGSGFLALDKNSNGQIDDGNELFGPNTNNGFAELKQYDEDGNDWIDENDSIFTDLRVWSKNDQGDDSLIALADANVGAIYLSDVSSSFDYDKSATQNLAHLKSTSIFLNEEGKAGIVTGVDFAVS